MEIVRQKGCASKRAVSAGDVEIGKVALLFTPPFERTSLDPGYVKGYSPGIRENGGQYTRAAAWSVLAYATDVYSVFPHVARGGWT